MAFELLTDHPPFAGDSFHAILNAHVAAPIPDVRELRPDVPPALAELVTELLAKSPEERTESSETVLLRLQAIRTAWSRQAAARRRRVLIVDDDTAVGAALLAGLTRALPGFVVESTSA